MQEKLFEILMDKDEITWQSLIYDLVKTEQMNPWDIDISLLSNKYLEVVRKLQEVNFFISGKMILASAILLKIKSNKLVDEDLFNFDCYLFNKEEEEELEETEMEEGDFDVMLIPKTPHARKRKVSVDDLIGALTKALEVDKRRTLRKIREKEVDEVVLPKSKIDIVGKIKEIYGQIKGLLSVKERMMFSELVKSEEREEKIGVFTPLVHLANDRINLVQEEHFNDIEIYLNKEKIEI